MNYSKLSADPLAMILGVLALVIGLASCCCYGVTAFIPLTMAIIGLVTANKSLREFDENPEVYSPQSRSNVSTAKIVNIIAIVINGLIMLIAIGVIIFYGTVFTSVYDEIKKNQETSDYYDFETELDSTSTWDEDDYIIEEVMDSINVDSIENNERELLKTFKEGGKIK